jgi:uncharacterized membrane protein YjjP (DUF1212 family)
MSSQAASADATYAQRIAFVCEIAARLHRYGTTAQRLEAAVMAWPGQLELDCEPWSNPTGMILSFSDPTKPLGTSDVTRVIRLAPGDNDLHKLSMADRVADAVAAGRMSVAQGHTALRKLDRPMGRRGKQRTGAGVRPVCRRRGRHVALPWLDIATAGVIGLLIGLLGISPTAPATRDANDALAALLAGAAAVLVASFVGALNLNTVIIAALVILLPGMSLTNAVNELASGTGSRARRASPAR